MGKHLLAIGVALIMVFGVVTQATASSSDSYIDTESNYPYINELMLESSRYTQTDETDAETLSDFHDLYTLSYTDQELSFLGFELVMENDALQVYFEKDSFSMMVRNKTTGYLWSSRPEYQGISGTRENNTANRNLMNSGLWVEYVKSKSVSSSTITISSLYSLADVSYYTNGSITEDNPDHLRPYYLDNGVYDYAKVSTWFLSKAVNAFSVAVDLKAVGFYFEVTFELTDNSVVVSIQGDSIKESDDEYRLLAIDLFPYFGSAREDLYPGYIVIPDGVGALVRTNAYYDTYFQSPFYGIDYGYSTSNIPDLSLPIYGMVHEASADGFYVNIIEGSEASTLISYLWGANTRYDRIYSRYSVRQIYQTVINKAGDGNSTITEELREGNYTISYNILSDDDASYVGIAKDYRDYLTGVGTLSSREKSGNGIPIQLTYIMSDREPSFLGTKKIVMTTSEDVMNAYTTFGDYGITNQQISLYGWSNDGFVHRAPYQTSISDRDKLEELINLVIGDGNSIYLEDDYLIATEDASRVTNGDIAKDLSRIKLIFKDRSLNGEITKIYMLYPEESLKLAESDVSFFEDLGISGLEMSSLGGLLFSYYDGGVYNRIEALAIYQQIAMLYDSLIMNSPNAYMLPYCDGYMSMPITNSQYVYYTDLVPLVPIVLKGSISYYTPFLNFNAMAEDRLLMMVDFAINPSFVLTEEETYQMRYTPSNVYYTTTLAEYVQEIVDTYDFVNGALTYVTGAMVESRTVLATGVVEIGYSNGVAIYVNYTYDDFSVGGLTVGARNYEVVLP